MIDLDLLLFERLAETGSLAAAARALGISAPMASRRLARLEARLGVPLAHRSTRRLALTAQGAQFHRDIAALLAGWREAEARLLQAARTVSGPLRISAPTSFGRLYVAPALAGFLAGHPEVDATLELSDGYIDLPAARIDVAIRIAAEIPPDLQAVRLADSRRLLCAAPAYIDAHGEPADLAALDRHRILAADGQMPWRLAAGRRMVTVAGRSHVRTNSSEVVRELALAGAGIALRSLWDVHGELASGRLRRVLPHVEGQQALAIHAVRPRAAAVPAAVSAFIAHMHALMQPVPPWARTAPE